MRTMLAAVLAVASVTIHAQAPIYQRGETVRLSDPSAPSVVRVVAIVGDRFRIDNSGVYVNDTEVAGLSDAFAGHIKPWDPHTVPVGHVVVLGDERTNQSISRFVGLVPVERVAERVS